jgi:hypothetical protein
MDYLRVPASASDAKTSRADSAIRPQAAQAQRHFPCLALLLAYAC